MESQQVKGKGRWAVDSQRGHTAEMSSHPEEKEITPHETHSSVGSSRASTPRPAARRPSRSSLAITRSHVSATDMTPHHGGDVEATDAKSSGDAYHEAGNEIYLRFSPRRKALMVGVLSLCGFLSPISSTTVLSAVPEVAAQYHTSGSIINVTNAVYQIFMGLSPLLWGPLGTIYGRRWPSLAALLCFFAFSVGTALAPNLAAFFIFRALTAFQGTALLILGASVIGDIYRPTERGTATGWFLSGTLLGPALGPFLGGLIVTFREWQVIFWLQSALAGTALVAVFFLLPETIHRKKAEDLKGLSSREKARQLWKWVNPLRVLLLFRYPNLMIIGLASSSLVWNMYSLLTPIRYVINPRFHLTTPLQSGLFYLAPGAGYLVGTLMGGRWADRFVKRYMRKRGERVPEDRLRSGLPFLGIVIPACMLVYGWCLEKNKGGIPVPVIAMFLQGVSQLFIFPSLNVYCLEVMQHRSAEVIAGNYVIRYWFGAAGTASVLPAVEKIGVGWFSTISAGFLVAGAIATAFTVKYGRGWREKIINAKEVSKNGEKA